MQSKTRSFAIVFLLATLGAACSKPPEPQGAASLAGAVVGRVGAGGTFTVDEFATLVRDGKAAGVDLSAPLELPGAPMEMTMTLLHVAAIAEARATDAKEQGRFVGALLDNGVVPAQGFIDTVGRQLPTGVVERMLAARRVAGPEACAKADSAGSVALVKVARLFLRDNGGGLGQVRDGTTIFATRVPQPSRALRGLNYKIDDDVAWKQWPVRAGARSDEDILGDGTSVLDSSLSGVFDVPGSHRAMTLQWLFVDGTTSDAVTLTTVGAP